MFEIDLKNKLISLIAKRNSGKSYLLRYMVKIQKHEFDKIFIICPTNILNDFYKNITEKENIFTEYNELWMESLIKKMTDVNSRLENVKRKNVLLILDDLVADIRFASCKSLKLLAIRGRHIGISIIMTSQYINTIPPIIRSNVDFTIVGNLNRKSLDLLEKESNTNLTRKEFNALYLTSTKDYGFFCINNTNVKNINQLTNIYGILRTPKEEFQ